MASFSHRGSASRNSSEFHFLQRHAFSARKDPVEIENNVEIVLVLGNGQHVLRTVRASDRWRRFDIAQGDRQHAADRIHHQPDLLFLMPENNDARLIIVNRRRNLESLAEIKNRNESPAKIDDAFNKRWCARKRSDFSVAEDLFHAVDFDRKALHTRLEDHELQTRLVFVSGLRLRELHGAIILSQGKKREIRHWRRLFAGRCTLMEWCRVSKLCYHRGTGDEGRFHPFDIAVVLCRRQRSTAIYGWPLEQNYGISATFGESRNDHFHAGIDISTNGDTGLPVLAIEAGEVYRLKVQKRGYGSALYIRHPNGMISVYGHLESYSSDLGIEQMYRKKVVDTGSKYVGDIFLDPPIPVERGTIVAYSGESGAGLPHLHLELRRGESLAVNPLTNGLDDTLDPVAPSFQAAYLYPAGPTRRLMANWIRRWSGFTRKTAGIWRITYR